MARRPVYAHIDLSTVKLDSDKAVVDIKLLESFFKGFEPTSLDAVKVSLKDVIDNCSTLKEIEEAVIGKIYVMSVAHAYHAAIQPAPERRGVEYAME